MPDLTYVHCQCSICGCPGDLKRPNTWRKHYRDDCKRIEYTGTANPAANKFIEACRRNVDPKLYSPPGKENAVQNILTPAERYLTQKEQDNAHIEPKKEAQPFGTVPLLSNMNSKPVDGFQIDEDIPFKEKTQKANVSYLQFRERQRKWKEEIARPTQDSTKKRKIVAPPQPVTAPLTQKKKTKPNLLHEKSTPKIRAPMQNDLFGSAVPGPSQLALAPIPATQNGAHAPEKLSIISKRQPEPIIMHDAIMYNLQHGDPSKQSVYTYPPNVAIAPSPFHCAQMPPIPPLVHTRSSTPPEETPRRASLSRMYEVLGPLKAEYAPALQSESGCKLDPINHEKEIAKEVLRRHGMQDSEIQHGWPRWSMLKLRMAHLTTLIHSLSSPDSSCRFIQFENLRENRTIGYAEVVWFSEFRYDDGTPNEVLISNRTPDSRDLLNCYCRVYNAMELFKGYVKVSRTDAFVSFPVNWIRNLVDFLPVLDPSGNPALNHFWVER